jgi:glucose-6-phosphate 1-dehydrogenase
MNLAYREHAEEEAAPDDYERLLLEAMAGDQTLFLGDFEMRFLWDYLSPLLKAWEVPGAPLHLYPEGSSGPAAADALLAQDGRRWF